MLVAEQMFLQTPAFPDSSLQKVAPDRSFEKLLRYRHQQAVAAAIMIFNPAIPETSGTATLSLGKKLFYIRLAAKFFFLGESMADIVVHPINYCSLKDKSQVPWQRKELQV